MKPAIEQQEGGFTTALTPSGIEVLYQWEPKRLYKVREHTAPGDAAFPCLMEAMGVEKDDQGDFVGQWIEVPSVTTVLEVLDKPALPWWGMKIGIEGTIAMHNMGLLESRDWQGQKVLVCQRLIGGYGWWDGAVWQTVVAGVDEVVELLGKHQLTVNHVRDKAGDRGQSVHDAFEVWAKEGIAPDPEMFPPNEQGYIRGLLAFLEHVPTAEPVACEVMVGSMEHGYAGRYDVRFRTHEPHAVVVHRTPVKGAQWRELPAGLYLGDLKTSKGVYPSHSRQLEAYEQASIECGYEPTVGRGILHVNADGTYEFVHSRAVFHDFRVVLDVWRSDQDMKARKN